jgi:hypothetical protein
MIYNSTLPDGKHIIYEENFWTGKKKIVINCETLQSPKKKQYIYEDQTYTLKGNFLTGAKLIGTTEIVILPKLKTWEYILSCLPLIMVFIGGAIGGLFGGLFSVCSASTMRSNKHPILKVIISLVFAFLAFIAWFIVAAFVLQTLPI